VDGQTPETILASVVDGDLRWGISTGFSWPIREGREVKTPATWADGPRPSKHVRRLLAGRHGEPVPKGHARFSDSELIPPLLRALDDPGRAAVAHMVLARLFGRDSLGSFATAGENRFEPRPDGSYLRVHADLRVELRLHPTAPSLAESTPGGELRHHRCIPSIDPAQWPTIRDEWHRQLDVPLGSARYGSISAGAAVLPLLWLARHARSRRVRRSRLRRGLCPQCGYDLRATPGRCPECGTAAAAKEASPAAPPG
jgi:hypothetical protein